MRFLRRYLDEKQATLKRSSWGLKNYSSGSSAHASVSDLRIEERELEIIGADNRGVQV